MNGIWIRSQDKKMLVLTQRVQVLRYGNGTVHRILNQVSYTYDTEDYDVLGEYSTETKALKVLDEIQAVITNGTTEAHEPDTGSWQKVEKYGVVYQMPMDEDATEGGEA